MSKFMQTRPTSSRLWLLLLLAATLVFAGCSDDDSKVTNTGSFHGKEDWASIDNLDPRGEGCVDCHGKNNDMSPYNSGFMAHNVGLQKNTDHSAYANLKITGVKINEETGEVTVTLNQALPANAGNLSMTFAKLAPRVIHNRGHDWQNYFVSNALGRGGNEPASSMLPNGGAAPQTVPNPQVNGKTITFNLGGGEGRSWGEHAFTVGTAYEPEKDTLSWVYGDKNDANVAGRVLGTKFTAANWKISEHSYCNEAATDSNQLANADGKKPLCWWPDSTHLTSGVFITQANEYVVAYQPDYTHRVTIILGSTPGNPGFNTWYDFVPSVANGTKTVVKEANKSADPEIAAKELVLPDAAPDYIAANGAVIAGGDDGYGAVGGAARNRPPFGDTSPSSVAGTALHQNLPAAREVVDVQSCNSCHDGLTMHGQSGRSQTQVCVTCHNPGNLQASSGRSVDFKVLIHRIHRGANLPSEDATIAGLMDGKLVADTASDFTKVRFPQGPTPGSAPGITNCVKCHMGSDTQAMIQKLAEDSGAGDENTYNVQKELKLAKVTAQGDNWLSVRSVNACQACHDSNIFLDAGSANSAANGGNSVMVGSRHSSGATEIFGADKTLPFYTDKYSGVGFAWMGKKLDKNQDAGWLHTRRTLVGTSGNNDGFTCGGGGGCHGNDPITTTLAANVGVRGNNNNIHGVHLELTRNFIIADRFEMQILEAGVDDTGLTAKVGLWDKQDKKFIKSGANDVTGITGTFHFNFQAMFGWMADGSPDYNHSTTMQNQPAAPTANVQIVGTNQAACNATQIRAGSGHACEGKALNTITTAADSTSLRDGTAANKIVSVDNGDGTYTFTQPWAGIPEASNRRRLADFDLDTSIGTAFVLGSLQVGTFNAVDAVAGTVTTYNIRAATKDFAFNGRALADDEGRRQVVDFTAGNGIDESRDRYAGWDKHDGANTQSCQSCHLQLAFHGGSRTNNTQLCIACHNPNMTDINNGGRQGKLGNDGQYEESEDFKRLIHAVHASADMRIDPVQHRANVRPSAEGTVRGHSFPGVLSNCQSCHIENNAGQWTFDLNQLPAGQIGSSAITGDWANATAGANYDPEGTRHDLANHKKMTPIASVCSSCHDAGYKTTAAGRTNAETSADGGPYIGSHWWAQGGIAPGIVAPGANPKSTIHQSGEYK